FRQILETEPARPRALNQHLDAGLEVIVLKCLQKNPARRYPTAGALAQDLNRWLHGGLPEPRNGPIRRLARTVMRHPLLVLAAILLAGFLIVGKSPQPPQEGSQPVNEEWDKLSRGQSVVLLGEKNRPSRFRWLTTEGSLAGPPEEEGFTINHSSSLVLLE